MSLAGFDIVVEIARSALLDLLKSNLEIAGQPANPPSEITVALPGGGLDDGIVHVIVDDLLLDLNADDTATLTFPFSNSSVLIRHPDPRSPPLILKGLRVFEWVVFEATGAEV